MPQISQKPGQYRCTQLETTIADPVKENASVRLRTRVKGLVGLRVTGATENN